MCGIVGLITTRPNVRLEEPLAAALASLARRGPDDHGSFVSRWSSGAVALGHTRLSIRDLSAAGRQPLANEDDSLQLVCNGEIYNADDLRAELETRGHRFRSHSDSEVILHGFEEHGLAFVSRLFGMFAFALWDDRRRRLWLVRDRLGIKPLLFARRGDGILFSTQLRTIAAWPGMERRLDPQGLHQYLTFGYTLTPRTILTGIEKLRPGHAMCFDAATGRIEETCYWRLADTFHRGADARMSESAAVDGLWTRISAAVDRRLVAEVPLGAFLSGGVDSSTIAALLGRRAPGAQTFCADFRESSFSEAAEAARSASALGLRHESCLVDAPTPEDMAEMILAADEPTADTSFVPYYRLSQFARQRVTVALSGDGADELLAGYPTYRANRYHGLVRMLPGGVRRWMAGSLAGAIRPGAGKVGSALKARQFLHAADNDPAIAHVRWRCLWQPEACATLLSAEALAELERIGSDPLTEAAGRFDDVTGLPFLQQALYVDLSTWMLDDILHKVDRASMWHALEVRVPFLDHTVVEFAAGVPPEMKLRGGVGKWLLREALRRYEPRLNISTKKQGFSAPVGSWINGTLRGWSDELLASAGELSAGCIPDDGPHVALLAEHRAGAADHGFVLWNLLSLLAWMRGAGR